MFLDPDTMPRSRCDRTCFFLLALICLTVIFSTAVVQILVVTLTAAVLLCVVRSGSRSFIRTPLDLPYLAFVIARVLTIAFSQYPARSVSALYIEYFFYVVFFLVTQSMGRSGEAAFRKLLAILVGAGAVAGLVGTVGVLAFSEARGSSTTAGPYTLGTFLCPVLALALLLPRRPVAGWINGLLRLAPVPICLGIVFTYDRLHWAGMGLALVVGAAVFRRKWIIPAVCAAVAAGFAFPSLRIRFEQLGDLSSLWTGRDVLWRGALMLLWGHPIVGFGPRTFVSIFPLFSQMPVQGVGSWHNDYLQVYMESGFLGLLPMLWVLFATAYRGWKTLRLPALPSDSRGLLAALLAALGITFLIGGVLDTLVGIVFRILLGMFALLVGRYDTSGKFVSLNRSGE